MRAVPSLVQPAQVEHHGRRTLRGLLRYFLKLGGSGFGGPIALVGYIHRDLVADRGWYTEEEFQQGLAVGQTMPGPLAAQVAMWLGYLQAGWRGALAVTVPFVLPPFLIVTASFSPRSECRSPRSWRSPRWWACSRSGDHLRRSGRSLCTVGSSAADFCARRSRSQLMPIAMAMPASGRTYRTLTSQWPA